MENFWPFITRFGDSAVLLSLAAVFLLALWRFESPRAAWTFAAALLCCMGALVLLKLLFISYGHTWYERLESPSGHAGLSVMVYGALALVLVSHLRERGARAAFIIAAVAATGFVLAIAVSRKVLGAHSVAEIMVGCAVGFSCLWMFWRTWHRLSHPPMPLWIVYGVLALLSLAMHETSFSPEKRIARVASRLKVQIRSLDLPGTSPGINTPSAQARSLLPNTH